MYPHSKIGLFLYYLLFFYNILVVKWVFNSVLVQVFDFVICDVVFFGPLNVDRCVGTTFMQGSLAQAP